MIIVRYSEIFLKGLNRGRFEHALVRQIKKKCVGTIRMPRNRILVYGEGDVGKVFGVHTYSRAEEVPLDMNMILAAAERQAFGRFESFCVDTQRLTKNGPDSVQINTLVGKHIADLTGAKVNLSKPALRIGIEIIYNHSYFFLNKKT